MSNNDERSRRISSDTTSMLIPIDEMSMPIPVDETSMLIPVDEGSMPIPHDDRTMKIPVNASDANLTVEFATDFEPLYLPHETVEHFDGPSNVTPSSKYMYNMGPGILHNGGTRLSYRFVMKDYHSKDKSVNALLDVKFEDVAEGRKTSYKGWARLIPCPNQIPVVCSEKGSYFTLPNGKKCTDLIVTIPDLPGASQPRLSERLAWPAWTPDEIAYDEVYRGRLTGKGKATTMADPAAHALENTGSSSLCTFFIENPAEYYMRKQFKGLKWETVRMRKQRKYTAFTTSRATASIPEEYHQSIIDGEGLSFPLTISWKKSGIWANVPDCTILVQKSGDTVKVSDTDCRLSHLIIKPQPKSRSWKHKDGDYFEVEETVRLAFYPDI